MNDFKSEERRDGGEEGIKEERENGQDAEQLSRPTPLLDFFTNDL